MGVVVLTGAGDKAFCTFGDQSIRKAGGYAGTVAAMKMLKYAFHAETDGVVGVTNLGVGGLSMFYDTEESMEGKNAFMEKRKPEFLKFR